ncbi:ABC transporter ATP-binding protein [Corynebacterium diphtheriae BH8]|uniref:ATP-binding cassette domain-containing protein n=1 Tax=Corynebacterium diphtheriae TaxID=1717 RepID=UPI000245BCD1|nr:ATP-binding cassette domain-containing protein [Corynebacterium diphtheriae]AEX47797.1 ABC transporter ATP-binding protein [Corynebacterium diphtheriae BH8]
MEAPIVSMRDVTIETDGGVRLVHVDELDIFRGDTIAITGRSGSGKTMLLRALCGAHTAGITVRGSIQRAQRAALIMQDSLGSLNPLVRCEKQVRLMAGDPHAARQALADCGITPELARRYPLELSGGQRQRVAIARALLGEPELVIADEAFSALDHDTARLLQDLLLGSSSTVIFVSHNVTALRATCDDLLIMMDGTVRYHGPADNVDTTDPEVAAFLAAAKELAQ